MVIRRLEIVELARVAEIDVSEHDTVVLSQVGTDVVQSPREWQRPVRSEAAWAPYVAEWADIIASGGIALGAFLDDRLVGIAIIRPDLAPAMAQLAALFVDRVHRRQGVAAGLVERVEGLAREAGATLLYVSASESRSAVGFYRSRGFVPTEHPDPVLLAREPLDIHMIKELNMPPTGLPKLGFER